MQKMSMEKKLSIAPENLGSFFKTALRDENNVFVFSTDVVKNSWADWCVRYPSESGTDFVLLERFTAWDKFKGEVVRGKEADKASIPSVLRKFFVSSLISENAACPSEKTIFKKIINPEFKNAAASFGDWISDILKSLKLWHKTVSAHPDYKMDDEDNDYLELFNRYSAFLDANNFFEPSWVEPDFSATGKHYFIFYPELFEDYSDYIDVFKNCPDITVVNLPNESESESQKIQCLKYSDSRKELRRTILQIRKLCAENDEESKKRTRWEDVALNVPDLPTYRPYIERELTRYCVPFVIKAGFPLIQNTAGQIFKEIQDCFDSKFSYESVRSLILDEYIPWKEDKKILRQNLIIEGNKMRCICGFEEKSGDSGKTEHFDSWEAALSATSDQNTRELDFYTELKHDISSICNSNSFDSIVKAWIIFKQKYLEEDDFSAQANDILGRCVTELKELAKIENEFCTDENSNLKISNHYDFFVTELGKKTYTPQSEKTGISVYPYKTSAGAFFDHHFVIDASQKNLEIQYKKLKFLNEEKRAALGVQSQDKTFNASKAFIRLYAAHFNSESDEIAHFSYAEKSFAGFAICHNALLPTKAENDCLDNEDFILNEKNYLRGKDSSLPLRLSKAQKEQFEKFQNFNKIEDEKESFQNETSGAVLEKVRFALVENRNKNLRENERDGKIVITQSDMKNFFPCPRKWIFSNVLSLEEETLDTDLMKTYDMGNINHKILELFMGDYLNSQKPLPVCEDGAFENEDGILEVLKKHALVAIKDFRQDYAKSPLSQKMLESQTIQLANNILGFLREFLKPNIPSGASINSRTKTLGYGGCIVRGVEKPFSAKNEGKNYNYFGKIDLLLSSSSENTDAEGWTIIDYKNTSASVPKKGEIKAGDDGKLGDFQMPMYVALVQANKASGKADFIDVARFYAIKDASSAAAIDRNSKGASQEDFEPTMEAFRRYSDDFENLVSSKKFAPDSGKVDKYEDCLKCNFKAVCRRTYEVSKRK